MVAAVYMGTRTSGRLGAGAGLVDAGGEAEAAHRSSGDGDSGGVTRQACVDLIATSEMAGEVLREASAPRRDPRDAFAPQSDCHRQFLTEGFDEGRLVKIQPAPIVDSAR